MELTPGQMEEIHGLLEGLLEEREAVELRRAELEQDMIAFAGTAEELDEILEVFRAESVEQAEAAREHVAEVIDRIKAILTLKQGEILAEVLPGLLGGRVTFLLFGQRDEGSEVGLRERLIERLEEHFAGNPELLERLQQRLGASTVSGPFPGMAAQCGAFGVSPRGYGRMMGRGFDGSGRSGLGFQRCSSGVNAGIYVQRGGLHHRGFEWVERLVEVLELKLEAIG
jgi:hypothetical protein